MSRRLREFPRLRAVAAVSVMLGGMRILPSCEPLPDPPSGACQTLAVASAPDHACMLVGPVVSVCGDGTADAGPGSTLFGCFLGGSKMRCWGSAALGRAELTSAPSPALVDFGGSDGGAAPGVVLTLAAGLNRTCAVFRGGSMRCWSGQESAANARDEAVRGVWQVAIGAGHLCVVLSDQTVQCKGSNSAGQSGSGALTTVNAYAPVALPDGSSLGDVRIIGAGDRFTCALGASGQVQCWGFYGQPLSRPRLVDVVSVGPIAGLPAPSANRMKHLAVGAEHACSVDQNGGVWCWGANDSGQLGDGTTTSRGGTAVAVRGLPARDPVIFVAAGGEHTCVRTQGGEVWCWGANSAGQLGDGSTTNRLAPVRVSQGTAPLAGASFITAAGDHTCVILGNVFAGATTRCWGRIGSGAPAQTTPTNPAGADLQCCAPTPAQPSGVCANTLTDARNCGRAGNVCPATQSCNNGTCGCAAGRMLVGSACLDTQGDVANCGAAGNRCALANVATQQCSAGRCVLAPGACAAGFADCDGMAANGCETNTATDTANCGACRTACAGANGTSTCAMGVCAALTCAAGFTDCDGNRANGCEANTATDARNCGACGRACTGANSMGVCAMGACGGLTCNAGFEDCNNDPTDGCETNTATTSTCASRPTALPAGSRAQRHVVNIISPDVSDRDLIAFFGNGGTTRLARAVETFYRSYRDEYDFLFVVAAANLYPDGFAGPRTAAQFTPVRRDAIPGTGVFAANQPAYRVGAPRQLRGVAGFNLSGVGSTPPSLHELLHYWGVSLPPALIGNGAHWNVSSVGGQLGGFPASLATCGSGGDLAACQGSAVCCPSGTTNCGGRCVDTNADPNHCGGCGIVCSTGPGTTANTCAAGRCVPTCATNFGSCDRNPANGCEVPTTTPEHCGDCFGVEAGFGCSVYPDGSYGPSRRCGAAGQFACPPPSGMSPCQSGLTMAVGPSSTICCAAGLANCGGVCATTATDRNNCGACGNVCATGPGTTANTCAAGRCAPTCAAGYADCDGISANGCEARLDSVTHCGRCGNRCAATDQACTASGATFSCAAAAGSAGRVCATGATQAGTCGGAQTCSGSASLSLPSLPATDACRAASGQTFLRWGTVSSPSDTIPYAPLELYLMGLVDRAGAGGPWYVLDGAQQPAAGDMWTGTRVRAVTLDDIVAQSGVRPPAPMSERAFKTAVVVFSATPVSAAWLDNIERWSSILGNDRTGDACFMSFERATGGRATMSTALGPTRRSP